MKFVNHLQRINRLFKKDVRIKVEHINLYNSLFIWWYNHKVGEKVAICHKRMMHDSSIKSRDTYNKTLIELDMFGYLMLFAPTEQGKPCLIKMIIIGQEDKKENDVPSLIRKLIREIIDRAVLLDIQLDKRM
jgi:hypothetical protein